MIPINNGGLLMRCAFARAADIFFLDATFRCTRTRRCGIISTALPFNARAVGKTGNILSCTFDQTSDGSSYGGLNNVPHVDESELCGLRALGLTITDNCKE